MMRSIYHSYINIWNQERRIVYVIAIESVTDYELVMTIYMLNSR
ncbi:hypothetical protein ACEF02_02585 [Staphylococcus borealis]